MSRPCVSDTSVSSYVVPLSRVRVVTVSHGVLLRSPYGILRKDGSQIGDGLDRKGKVKMKVLVDV